ncbi:hypothetical protein LINPERHAP2_LOCUS29074 [Linum perenne]
MAGYRKIEV